MKHCVLMYIYLIVYITEVIYEILCITRYIIYTWLRPMKYCVLPRNVFLIVISEVADGMMCITKWERLSKIYLPDYSYMIKVPHGMVCIIILYVFTWLLILLR